MCINLSTGPRCRDLSNDLLHFLRNIRIVLKRRLILYMISREILSLRME